MPNSLSAIDYVKSQLAEHLLEYSQAVTKVREELDSYYALTILSNARRGVMISTVQTVNDFCDLLDDIKMGRGRPAMRALRSIFESLITILALRVLWGSGGSVVWRVQCVMRSGRGRGVGSCRRWCSRILAV